jgi:ABC-type transport system involved in multi-copper enzyme maturation permease subunit
MLGMTDNASQQTARYSQFVSASFSHALLMMLRRRRVVLAAAVVLSPVIVPLALAFLSATAFAEDGNRIFVNLVESLYLKAMAPLLALFFGCMLIGEDVESETIPYLLTRPVPRSAMVIGRFFAYLAVASTILIVSIGMLFAGCTSLGNLNFGWETVPLLAHYEAVAVLALLSYGALAVFLGTLMKHPVIIGILFIFGWQPVALQIPGAADFLTIEKYLLAILPKLATERENPVVRTALAEFQKQQLLIDASTALLSLAAATIVLVGVSCLVVRWREYSAARAVGG